MWERLRRWWNRQKRREANKLRQELVRSRSESAGHYTHLVDARAQRDSLGEKLRRSEEMVAALADQVEQLGAELAIQEKAVELFTTMIEDIQSIHERNAAINAITQEEALEKIRKGQGGRR